jgi:hypothetical protein
MGTRLFQLLPRHKFQLFTWGEDGTGFVRVFRSCWKKIPSGARRAMLAHWRSGDLPHYPSVELSKLWVDSNGSFGQVTASGMKLKFSAEDFAIFPDSIAGWVIAHELAHVYQSALGRPPDGVNVERYEREADDIAKRWGFDNTPTNLLRSLTQMQRLSVVEACKKLVRDGRA